MTQQERTQRPKARFWSLRFWKAYWLTMRPYLLLISGAAGMAGYASGPQRGIGVFLIVFPVFFLSYGFGQAFTDCFHIDTDSISSPYRPLVQGIIDRKQVLAVSLTGLVSGCLILFFLNTWTLLVGGLAVFGIATYTYFKRKWWAGPIYDGWIVALLPLLGWLAASGPGLDFRLLFQERILLFIMVGVFFSYANFVLMGYFKDISADRQSGYRTFMVVFGWKKAALASDFLAFFSLLAVGWGMFFWLASEPRPALHWVSLPFFAAAVVVLVMAQVGIHRIRDEHKAFKPIAHVVRGFILLRLTEIVLLRPLWAPAVLIFYLGFEWILHRRPSKEQV